MQEVQGKGETDSGQRVSDEQFREIIAAADELYAELSDSASERHRAAVVDIHAYLALLAGLTESSIAEIKDILGCRRTATELPQCDLEELARSRDYLSIASDVAMTAVKEPEGARAAVTMVANTFRIARNDSTLLREGLSVECSGGRSPRDAIAVGDLTFAEECLINFLSKPRAFLSTRSGSRVPVEIDTINALTLRVIGAH